MLLLLQSLACDLPHSALLAHITSQPEALAEYLRAALLCGQVGYASVTSTSRGHQVVHALYDG